MNKRVEAAINKAFREQTGTLGEIRELSAVVQELDRRIENALDLLDGREGASCEPGEERYRPNLEMQIGMALRGEDRP